MPVSTPATGSPGPPLRVAMVAPGEIFGGAERQILTLLRASRTHTQAHLLTFHDGQLAARAHADGFEVTVIGARGLIDFASVARLRGALDTLDPDIVHMHGYRAAVYCAGARRARAGYLKTEHGRIEAASARLADRARVGVYANLERLATRHLGAHCVCVTAELAAARRARSVGPESVIYNGIEPIERAALARPAEFTTDRFNVVAVGRLDPVKGLQFALRAWAMESLPAHALLHLVGAGPCEQELLREARALGVDGRVRFTGFRANAHDYIAHADALLMPSLHEGLPYTVLEAMSLGTPILASKVGGLAEVLDDGNTALLFEVGDVGAIAARIARLASDPAVARSLADKARTDCAARFTASTMATRYLELYRSLRRARPAPLQDAASSRS